MALREHEGIPFERINGLWQRGDPENTPLDHFQYCDNLIGVAGNTTIRPGVGLHQTVAVPLKNVQRMYNYPTQTANTLIVLVLSPTNVGEIYHVVDEATVFGPILSIAGMTDFAFVPYAGRAYISPFSSFVTGDLNIEKGLQNEFLYVYPGDGTPARKAAGATPSGTLTIANGAAGYTDAGLKVFGVVGETDTGYLSAPIALKEFTTVAGQSVSFGTVPIFAGAQWVKRHIVSSITIPTFNGDLNGYPLFFIPDAVINNNTDAFLNNVSFYDIELIEDASHLSENYQTIPAGATLTIYHDRLALGATFDDISLALLSYPGEPEAINQITGLIIAPLDGNPITNLQELRDVFYVFKRARTLAYTDNGEEPSDWPLTVIDNALGTCVHGVATVLDSGAASVDYLIVCTYAGIILFNGRYILPQLSWKIKDFWAKLDRNEYRKIQIMNAPIQNWILCVLPDGRVLTGDTDTGMDPKGIGWYPWTFNVRVNCLAIVNIDQIIIGSPLVEV